ncbi:SCF complex F-box protein MET30 [Suhomyces tanzawaensis NRRL Y-17324]|uniref:SCF complex F-box protein MET30 n=1 Tax=Suhomyces tanzawaensis NRRL Y-17324 TaxID=984487 RepID=A0A1E4SDT9_9ASCO|nr:SCF complex F-box protein MET30 [Suhomyces tanzawaensis NRRL Y-17324]ODV77626.1 SCF complex F-box protein MET30 [Suhomyces tanzawaensis NRRL Y-17324]
MNLHENCTPKDDAIVSRSYESILSATASSGTSGSSLNAADASEYSYISATPNPYEDTDNNGPETDHKHSVTTSSTKSRFINNTDSTALSKLQTPPPQPQNDEVSVVTPFLVKHINDQSKIPKDNFHKYCYRHNPEITCNKSTDEARMKRIQTSLDRLPSRDQEAITHVWSIFSASPLQHRELILKGLLSQCCFPQLSFISQEVSSLIRIDFLSTLPMEISLKILCYLDCRSLCNAAQVSRKWKALADDDRVWHHMCEQHIDRKCPNCGWGLPLMHMKRAREMTDEDIKPIIKRKIEELEAPNHEGSSASSQESVENPSKKLKTSPEEVKQKMKRRPWKSVYSERFKLEKNWRKGIYTTTTFKGHTDGVTCLQFNRKYLMTGSYDATIKIWKVDTGECLKTLSGHTKGVRSLVFDSQKLITGGLDSTIKVWNYHTGQCIATYRGHDDAVVSVDFANKSIVSGSADHTIKVWHVDSRTCYTLRGHTDWVNCVKIHPASNTVFSASDDTTIRMWDLQSNQCLRVFGGMDNNGHLGQVQSVIPFTYKENLIEDGHDSDAEGQSHRENADTTEENETDGNLRPCDGADDELASNPNYPTHLITCSLDNTIKLWCVKTGKCIRTQFGHIEGVWSINADTFRIISGAHDRLIKVWDLQNGKCLHTFANDSYVSCVGLSDSKFAAGLENGLVKMYSFE